MKFLPYRKIPTDTSQFNLSKKENNNLFREIKWVVLEKVHGANFSIYCNGHEVLFAKRTAFLENHEWFYSYQNINDILNEKAKNLYSLIKSIKEDTEYIIVYGELFGGFYPSNIDEWKGPIISKRINDKNECIISQENRAIQEGIYYSPNIEYIVFDICCVSNDENITFTDYDLVMNYCEKIGLNYLEPLLTAPYVDCINYNYNFDSTVATKVCKQKKLPIGTNIAEGIVIKPLDASITIQLKKNSNKIRPLVKLKNKLFLEISGDFNLPTVTPIMILSSMININRLNSLLSKIGKFNHKELDNITDLFVDDIWMDYYEKFPNMTIDNYNEISTDVYNKSKDIISKNLH